MKETIFNKVWKKAKGFLPLYLFTLLPLFVSCEDFFETDSDRQIFDPALNEKTDSMFYTLGIMKGLQQVADQYVMVGEMRGDLVATNMYTETDLRELADFSADASNKFNQAYLYYNIINNCNYYIAHRDTMLLTGSRKVAIPEYVEALAVRAWTYMQLAKIYGEVPFYTDPVVSIDDANRSFPTKDLQAICDALAPELMKYSGTVVPDYGNISAGVLNGAGSSSEEKVIQSSMIMLPVDAVLGDLFLETNDYEKAAQYYFNYIKNNSLVAHQAYIYPRNYSQLLGDKLPSSDVSVYYNEDDSRSFSWASIFNISSPRDVVTFIPLASNKLRGVTTELPGYFGFDFYSTTSGTSSYDRYLVNRQIDASSAYINLNKKQNWYYVPTSSEGTGTTIVKTLELGDLRRFATMTQVTKEDSTFSVMSKFISANVPIYRTATIYLRLAEAMNRMGQPEAAFAILKDGINPSSSYDYFHPVDSTPDSRMSTLEFLTTKVPFLSKENSTIFENNWGIHSRGTNYTMGSFSPYQLDTLVTMKLDELKTTLGITPTGTLNDTINAVEDLICDEMALELAFEGSRFGDLTRFARHKNKEALYSSNFGSLWLARKLAYKNPSKSLADERNWYLPLK